MYASSLKSLRGLYERLHSGDAQKETKRKMKALGERERARLNATFEEAQESSPASVAASHYMEVRRQNEELKKETPIGPRGEGIDTRALYEVDEGGSEREGLGRRPKSPLEGLSGSRELQQDEEFMASVERLEEKFPGLNRRELFQVIKGESSFNPRATNKFDMAGLFQISPESAERLGTSKEEILNMSPAEQVDLYGRYLEMWDYNPDMPLAIMQAAPAKANLTDQNAIVYNKGSEAWKANPGWRSGKDGPITVASLRNYYRRQK